MAMIRVRFVHAGDLHLDTPFQGISRVAPNVAEALRDASLAAWDRLVQLVIEREANFLLLAGDIYDGPERGVRAQLKFYAGLQRLTQSGIQTFIVHGNHDPLNGWSAIRDWPTGVTVFGANEVESVDVIRNDQKLATIHGISYAQREVTENLSHRFHRTSSEGLQIGLLHCNLGNDQEHAPYSPCSVDDLRLAGMNYWALGHAHRHRVVHSRNPCITYSGSLQGRSIKPGEDGPKGALIVEAENTTITNTEFVALDLVRFVTFELDIASVVDLPSLRRALSERSTEIQLMHEGRGLLLRVLLFGHGEVHKDLRRMDILEELLKELRREANGVKPFIWWDSLIDETSPSLDLDAIRQRNNFSAELLELSAKLQKSSSELRNLIYNGDEPLKRAGVPRVFDLPEGETDLELLKEAEQIALELLEDELKD